MRKARGQVAVEAAITLPLVLFMILGALQLFMMLQARILAQYAVARMARIGSVNHGSCEAMTHAGVATLLPSFSSFLGPSGGGGSRANRYVQSVRRRINGNYDPNLDSGHDEPIFWIVRESPTLTDITPEHEDAFDLELNGQVTLLELRMIYFYPLRIPFANWVMARIVLTQFGLQSYAEANPYIVTQRNANWTSPAGAFAIDNEIGTELLRRFDRRHFVAPIDVTFATRMMSPAWRSEFRTQNCPPAPETL